MFESQIKLLSEEELDHIHEAALEVLRDVGARVEHERMRALLADHGCQIDGEVVKFPKKVVEDTVARMRDPALQEHLYVGTLPLRMDLVDLVKERGAHVIPVATGQAIMAHDLKSDKVRPATVEDLVQATRLVAALPEAVMAHPIYIPQDVPEMVRDLYALITVAENYPYSDFVEIYSLPIVPYFLEVGRVIRGSDEALRRAPPFCSWAFVTSPLRFGRHGFDIIFALKDFGIEQGYGVGGVMPVLGISAPITLSGYLVMQTAETLACNVMNWALLGRVTGYGAGPVVLDMHYMTPSQSAPEAALLSLASMELQRYYGNRNPLFPYALSADAKFPDIQAGIEKAYTATLAIAAGCRLLTAGLGVLSQAQVVSMAQIVIDYELCRMLDRVVQGFQVDEETIGLQMIKQVGIGGSFLGEPHTVYHMRRELFFPELFDHRALGEWLQERGGMLDRAKEKVNRILRETPPAAYLTPEQVAEIRKIAQRARENLTK
jgi:trimethylamine--corrinoid protein Co-methyltransferase